MNVAIALDAQDDFLPPLDQQLAWLDELADDPSTYAQQWLASIQTAGGGVVLELRAGKLPSIMVSLCHESMPSEMFVTINTLTDHMVHDPARRPAVIEALRDRGQVMDYLPAEPQEVTAAIREFLSLGGRVMLDPEGAIQTAGFNNRLLSLDTPEHERQTLFRVGRRMNAVVDRYANRHHVKRVLRILGERRSNGWVVLEAPVC